MSKRTKVVLGLVTGLVVLLAIPLVMGLSLKVGNTDNTQPQPGGPSASPTSVESVRIP